MAKELSADQALTKFISMCIKGRITNILDIGAGKAESHAKIMRGKGLKVDTIDFFPSNTYQGDYNLVVFNKEYDGIWCSHVLEHQPNVGSFLRKIFTNAKDDGVVCITVPPLKDTIVGGHLSLWNAGLLIYNMILAGFDCSEAKVKSYGYNISVIVRKKKFKLPPLTYDTLDVKRILKPYFPIRFEGKGFNGDIKKLNWDND